jgi:AcrR family transcriptional regulator
MDETAMTLTDRKRRVMMLRVQDAAFRMAFDDGYEAVTVEAIASAAEVSASTIYRAFGTKEGIFLWDELELPMWRMLDVELARRSPIDASIAIVEGIGAFDLHLPDAEIRRRFRFVLTEPALRSKLDVVFRGVELEFADRFEAAGAANRTEARIIAAATMAAIIAAMDDWQEATPAQPFVSAGAAAAASLRAVLNG